MLSQFRSFTPLPVLIFSLAAGIGILGAAPVITTATNTPAAGTSTTSTTDETIYNAFVSTTDLLHGITGTGNAWNSVNGSTNPTGLNDGSGAGDSNVSVTVGLTGAAWAANGNVSFREFFLGNGANGLGYNITEVQTIAAWQGASFQNQKYEILVSTVGSSAFTLLTTVDFQPASGTSGSFQGGATKVNVTDSSGILATGIDAIRFNILDSSGATAGGLVMREIDVFGAPTPVGSDLTPPTLNTLTSVNPADNATNVPVDSNLVATFSESIALTGAGSITLKNQSGGADIPVVLPGGVSITGAVLTINPPSNLVGGQQYAVEISSDAIRDLAATPNGYAGLLATDTPNWSFTASSAGLVAKVFLLGGQSNMVGQASSSELPTSPVNLQQPQEDVLFYYPGSALTTLRPGSGGNPPPSGLHFGPEVTFGRAVADASPTVTYAIIKHAENGTALYNDWAPGTGASYTAFRNTVANGLAALQAAGYTPEIVGMLWHQGESDAIEGQQASYGNNLTAFIADIRSRYGANLPFLIGEIRRSNGPAFVTVADAQIAVAAAVPNSAFVPASDLTFSDTYHFNAPSLMTLGERYAAATQSVLAETSSTTQFTFAGKVSASDLLHGLTPVTTGWNTTNNASPLELTDGIHGGAYQAVAGDAVQGAWTTVGATATYQLNTALSSAGYNITSIQSIADWQSVGFGNQAWTIEVKPVGGSYRTLATVNYQPFESAQGGTSKVNLTDPSGVLASGIEFIKVTANSVNGGANAGAFVWRELDVFGVPTPDATAPTIIGLSPVDGSTGVSPAANLVANFSENIALGSGNITIKDLDTPSQTVITLPDARVSVSGTTLTINPATDLAPGTDYAVWIDATAIVDTSGNPFAGIADDAIWNFTTGVPDLTAPTVVSLSPPDNATNVPLASNLVATFNENIALGSGSITLKNLDTLSQTMITLPDARVSISGAVLTINPSTNLAARTQYAVRIGAGVISDLSGNPFAGIADDTTWNFRTASAPLRIMCLGDSITVGYTDNPNWVNHPFKFGYRSGLYTRLNNTAYNFLFVGASTEPWTGISGDPTYGGTYKPALDLRDFGQDGHRGYGGKAASFLNTNILSWLATDNPDIILLKIGTNSQDQSGLNTLVNTITTNQPNCHLIIAQIMPKYSYQAGIVTYNTYIRDTLVPNYQALGKKVSVVDQYAPFLTNPADLTSIDQSLFSNGINHPDNDGYDKMAQVWFNAIEALGVGPGSFTTWIGGFPSIGGQTGLGDDPDGDGVDNGVENFFGTDPGKSSAGLVAGIKSGNSFTFTHLQNTTPATNVSAFYQWSKDLVTFHASGATDGDGTTVTLTAQPNSPSTGTTTVTATMTGTPTEKLFFRVAVAAN